MNTPVFMPKSDRLAAAMPFLLTATFAIVVGGLVAAAIAHAPGQKLVWMVAYLILVGGVAQVILGGGQALLTDRLPSGRTRLAEVFLFNAGNVGVIFGTIWSSLPIVWAGTLLFAAALVMFMLATRVAGRSWLVYAYRLVLLLVGVGAITGLVLASAHALR